MYTNHCTPNIEYAIKKNNEKLFLICTQIVSNIIEKYINPNNKAPHTHAICTTPPLIYEFK